MKIENWVYTLDLKKIFKSRKPLLQAQQKFNLIPSSDSGSFTSGLAGDHLHLLYSIFFLDTALK